jgi:ABC-2 type transport system ATP-binding protein
MIGKLKPGFSGSCRNRDKTTRKDTVIRIENITKYYGNRLAVDDISVNVEKGEIVGFLGPNGAGKSTTMRIITGFLMPTRGDVWIGDHNMATDSLDGRRLIGYLPEAVPLYLDMTTRAYLQFAARIRGLDKKNTLRRVDAVVEQCGLEEYIDVLLAKLSKGFRQRVGLAQAIIHDPEVLILDEPTIGIDPIQMSQTRQLIKELGEHRTILISTHILPEVSMTCERVIIINDGRIVAQDRIENLSTVLKGGKRLRLKVQGPAAEVTSRLERISTINEVVYEEPYHIVGFSTEHEPQAEISQSLVGGGWILLAMESVEMSLEDIFLQLTSKEEEIQ